MRVFIAGIIQGGRTDGGLHPQDYRRQIRLTIAGRYPHAEFVDPHEENPSRLGWGRARQREMFLRYVVEAGRCDLLVAWLPETSMGTAVEMYEACRAGVPVLAIGPLVDIWAVFSLAAECLPDMAAFVEFVAGPRFPHLLAGRGTGASWPAGVELEGSR